MYDFPDVGKKIETGVLNLSTATMLQSAFAQEKRRLEAPVPVEQKRTLVLQVEHKTQEQTQKIIAESFPHFKKRKESLKAIGHSESKLSVVLEDKATAHLKRIKELLSHSHPHSTWGEIVAFIADDFLSRKDPLRKVTHPVSAAETGCVIPENTRRLILQRANGQCEFIDKASGRRCDSRHQIELDHIVPKALGGGNQMSNLRALCKAHNLFEAELAYGRQKIDSFRAKSAT